MKKVKVEFKLETEIPGENGEIIKFDPEYVICPSKKKPEDAGYDVFSAETVTIPSGGMKCINTGVRLAVPLGWFYEIKGRSGLGFKGIQPFIGTIDATYCGLIRILLINFGSEGYTVNKGDRIAQILFHEQCEMEAIEVEQFSGAYNKRGDAGFGSSGK